MNGFAGLRVGLIGPVPPPAGGMANQTRQLAELLRSAQAEVSLVSTNAAYRPAWLAGVRGVRAVARLVAYVSTLWTVAGRCDLFHVMANSGWSWHLFAVPPLVIGRLRGVPVIINYRGGGAAEFLARSQRLVQLAMRRAAALIVPSGFLVDVFQRFGMTAQVVPNIVDLSRFSPRPPGTPGEALHLLVARNLEPLYDNATALRALALLHAKLPQATLTVAGSGPEAGMLRSLARELGIADAVTFTGRLDPAAMAALYRSADVSLNPSLADNMPNSLLESMACGVPAVSTGVGGVPYLVRDGETALLVPPGDARAMADAVLRLARDPALWMHLAASGVKEVQRYTWPQVSDRLADVYRSVLKCTAG